MVCEVINVTYKNVKYYYNQNTISGITSGGVTFTENVKHGYEFFGKTSISVPTGDSQDTSEVSIKGIVNVIGTQKCGAIVYLKNIVINQGSKVFILYF